LEDAFALRHGQKADEEDDGDDDDQARVLTPEGPPQAQVLAHDGCRERRHELWFSLAY
jgi:phosphohistidine phosphatase SixA